MDNREVANILGDIARMLELEGEDAYRIRAYRKASESVTALKGDINEYGREGRLQEIPGVGKSIGELIAELLRTGTSPFYESLKKETPPELFDVVNVPGIGRKTAIRIHKALGVTTVEEFKSAAKNHRIRKVRGLGDKIEKKILDSIVRFERVGAETRIPIFRALGVAAETLSYLDGCGGLQRAEVTGSVRRRAELVGDINVIAISSNPREVVDCFCNSPVSSVTRESTGRSARVATRYRVDATLEVVDPRDFGLHMVFDTGSPAHLDALIAHASGMGVRLSHEGYVDAVTLKERHFDTEEALYGALGLDYVPPELREGRGEVDAAARHELPDLIQNKDIRGDLHVHSEWSDGANTIQDMAIAAQALGYEYMAVCDHSRSLGIANGLSIERLRDQMVEIDRINDTLEDFTVLKGSEVDIKADGSLDLPDDVLGELDIVVASVHTSLRQEPEAITQRVLSALENEHVTILAHPTSRIIGRRPPTLVDMDAVIASAVEHGKALEVNSYPDRLDLSDENVRKTMDAGALISIDTDAHSAVELDFMEFGVANARRGWATRDRVLNTMSYTELLSFLGGGL
jgi:DNA polymerase (family 10)